MPYICDLHIHSKYSRACSKELTLENIDKWAKLKGIDIIGTGDFTHPAWFNDIENQLEEAKSGLYKFKGSDSGTLFMLTTELSCIYKQGGKARRLHICILAPNIDFVKKLIKELKDRGCNLAADGRPIIGLSAKELLKICLEIDENHLTIPAHAWTPWFAIFGSKSGFDSIEECYEELSEYIYSIETGLSSDPLMNRRLSKLDNITLISNSDAHSLPNLGREANVFDLQEASFKKIFEIIKDQDKKKFLYTIEFFPEEGMYHFDGHRECKISFSPAETKKRQGVCPQCKKLLTIGVLNRVDNLADRTTDKIDEKRIIPYKSLIPLQEIIADSLNVGKQSKKVQGEYFNLINKGKSEFNILLNLSGGDLNNITSGKISEGIMRVREGRVKLTPGFDGQYGKIEIFSLAEKSIDLQSKLF
ncbi:endonuclease Q family protein [Patescibacteria group bacterium]|nr:endonuclease Q family protein [Patescibacteria group bacterium]